MDGNDAVLEMIVSYESDGYPKNVEKERALHIRNRSSLLL